MSSGSLDAIIVGAGAAGLAAAGELARARARFVLLEARSRAGGRIWTARVGGVPVELGAEFVHGRPRAAFSELEKARLAVRRVPPGRAGPRGRAGPASWSELKRLLRRLNPKGADRPFSLALERLRGEPPELKEAAARFIQGYDAADLRVVSARDVSENADELDGAARLYRFEAGYDGLVRGLMRRVPRGALRRLAVVERIDWSERGVRVRLLGGEAFLARGAVVTLPVGVLRARAVRFVPALPRAKRRAISRLRMGSVTRVGLLFKRRAWPSIAKRFSAPFLDAPGGPFSVFWTSAPFERPLIIAWSGGPPARRLVAMPRAAVVAEAVAGLAKALGLPPRIVRSGLRAALFHDWSGDPFCRGAYSYLAAGGGAARAELAKPAGRLFFAGEACDSKERGTVAGALASGRAGAKALLAALRRSQGA